MVVHRETNVGYSFSSRPLNEDVRVFTIYCDSEVWRVFRFFEFSVTFRKISIFSDRKYSIIIIMGNKTSSSSSSSLSATKSSTPEGRPATDIDSVLNAIESFRERQRHRVHDERGGEEEKNESTTSSSMYDLITTVLKPTSEDETKQYLRVFGDNGGEVHLLGGATLLCGDEEDVERKARAVFDLFDAPTKRGLSKTKLNILVTACSVGYASLIHRTVCLAHVEDLVKSSDRFFRTTTTNNHQHEERRLDEGGFVDWARSLSSSIPDCVITEKP